MKFLAAYVMRGPAQAVLVSTVAAVLALMLPPFSYLSGAAVGLVTLRIGARPGLNVVLWSSIAASLLAVLLMGTPVPALAFLAALWLPVLVMASSLRRTVSMPRSLLLSGLFGLVVVLGFHLAVEDPAAWWRQFLGEALQQLQLQTGAGEPALSEAVEGIYQAMTGAVAAALMLGVIGSLLLARWWQSLLYNPGGFGTEFRELRFGRHASWVTAALLLVVIAGVQPVMGIAGSLLWVALLLHAIQGIAVVHGLVAVRSAGRGWLIGMYVLMLLALWPVVLMLALAGLMDNWFDFRRFFARQDG